MGNKNISMYFVSKISIQPQHYHLLTQRISEISSTKLYSKMTKTKAAPVNLFYLIFNSSIF